jgi:hypothetical protein
VRHPKHNPLNGLPARIGNPAGIASRHGNCRGLSQPPAPISTKKPPATFFPYSARVAQNLRCLLFTTEPCEPYGRPESPARALHLARD